MKRKITGAEEKIILIEMELYEKLLLELQDYIAPMQANGNILAMLDCIALLCKQCHAIQLQKTPLA